jgi:hypothetical protein
MAITLDEARRVLDEYNSRGPCGSVRQFTRDAEPSPFIEGAAGVRADYREALSHERTEGGLNPGGGVGPRRILRLDGPASAYQIISSADGETWLCFSGKIDGSMDPGAISDVRTRTRDAARARAEIEQARSAAWAKDIADFWKRQRSANG